MSIINDALKKADYFRRWKSVPAGPVSQTGGNAIAVEERPAALLPKATDPASETSRMVASEMPKPAAAELKVNPVELRRAFTFKFESPVQLSRLVLIIFVTSGSLLLLLGPWLYIWKDNPNLREPQKAVAVSPRSVPAPAQPVRVIVPAAEKERAKAASSETQTGQLADENPTVKPMYREYLNPNVQPSVKPLPRTLQSRRIESYYHLTGISVLSEKDKVAFINGKVLEVGGKVDEAEVLAIESDKVLLRKGNKEFSLRLEE